MTQVRRATPADVPALAATLASAFAQDPLFRWMTGLDDTEERLGRFWQRDVAAAVHHADHLVYLTEDASSAAVWRGVDRWRSSAREALALLPSAVGAMRLRLPRAVSLFRAMERAHPTEPHLYLESLGTREGHQGRGGGAAVIGPMLERCDTEGIPAYLESSNPRNVSFYARQGFVAQGEIRAGRGGPSLTAMWREPRG